jgi:hypothetical protein
LGPAEQLEGGSRLISASSFCILLAHAVSEVVDDHGLPANPVAVAHAQSEKSLKELLNFINLTKE